MKSQGMHSCASRFYLTGASQGSVRDAPTNSCVSRQSLPQMIFSKFFSKTSNAVPHSTNLVNLQYERLEPLRVLNADYDFSIADFVIQEGDVSSLTNIVEVTRSDSSLAESIDVILSSSSINGAEEGIDFVDGPITVDFGVGEFTKSVEIEILGDAMVEADEGIDLSLGNFSNGGGSGTVQPNATLTIENDDQTTITLSGPSVGQYEGSGIPNNVLEFNVTASNAVQGGFQVVFTTNDGTATVIDQDYFDNDGFVNFSGSAGESQTIDVTIVGDDTVELDETFSVSLVSVTPNHIGIDSSNISIIDSPIEATILNDDIAQVSIDDVTISETDSGTSIARFTISLDQEVDFQVTVDAATFDIGSATDSNGGVVGDFDFASNLETITFEAGETEHFFDVEVNGDEIVELDEFFEVRLSNLQAGERHVLIDDGVGRGTLINDDIAIISIDDVSMDEGDSGHTNYIFTVSRDKAIDTNVQFDFATEDGTAKTSELDYTEITTTTRVFASSAAGATETIVVSVIGDTHFESGIEETFSLALSNLIADSRNIEFEGGLASETAAGNIINDDTQTLVRLDVNGNLVITDEVVSGTDDELTISFNAVTNEIIVSVDGGDSLLGTGGASSVSEVRIDKSNVLGQIIIDTGIGNDIITIDLTNGNPLPPSGIVYEGGVEGDDGLALIGNGEATIYTPDEDNTGNGTITVDGLSIEFSGLEPVDISGMSSVTVMLAGSDDIIDISEGFDFFAGGTESAILVSGSSNGVPIEVAALWNNDSVIVDTTAVDGDDTITLSGANNTHLNTNLSIITGLGNDIVSVNGDVTLSGKLAIESDSIDFAADVTATDLLLVATSDIDQSAGVITATNFIVDADGSATLTGSNLVDRLAADAGVDFTFNNTIDLFITELTCGLTTVTGLTVGGDANLTLTGQALSNDRAINVTNKLAIESDSMDFAADVAATDLLLVTTADINQSAGVITATNFIVDAGGSATLTGNNLVDRLAADAGVDFAFNNTIDLLITELTCDGTTVNGLTVGSDAELTLTGQAVDERSSDKRHQQAGD